MAKQDITRPASPPENAAEASSAALSRPNRSLPVSGPDENAPVNFQTAAYKQAMPQAGPTGTSSAIWRNAPLTFAPRFSRQPKAPVYPSRSVSRGDQGEVILRVLINAAGEAREIVIYRSSGYSLLDRAAEAAAKRWQFAPSPLAGIWQETWVQIPVKFQLN